MWLRYMATHRLGSAAVSPEVLVDYNDGPHTRLTVEDVETRFRGCMAIYVKHHALYDPRTTQLFFLKNIAWLGQPLYVRAYLSHAVARLEGRSTLKWAGRSLLQLAGIGPVQRP
jgi:hypothetical protein